MNTTQWLFGGGAFGLLLLVVGCLVLFTRKIGRQLSGISALSGSSQDAQASLSSLPSQPSNDAAVLALLRQQLHEARESLRTGDLDQQEFNKIEDEIQLRLLAETSVLSTDKATDDKTTIEPKSATKSEANQQPQSNKPNQSNQPKQKSTTPSHNTNDAPATATMPKVWRVIVPLIVLLLIGSGTLYAQLGYFPLLGSGTLTAGAEQEQDMGAQMSPEQIVAMVDSLEQRLKKSPEDIDGWAMLGRSHKILKNYDKAVDAYNHCEPTYGNDPAFLVEYAETMSLAQNGSYAGKPFKLLQKAIEIQPNNQQALFFAGLAAMQAQEKKLAVQYWQALLPLVAGNPEIKSIIEQGIAKAQQ